MADNAKRAKEPKKSTDKQESKIKRSKDTSGLGQTYWWIKEMWSDKVIDVI